MNLVKFKEQLPEAVLGLFSKIVSEGFKIGVIGGASRDFLMGLKASDDYDCEVRSIDDSGDLIITFQKMIETLGMEYKIAKRKYEVYSISVGQYEVDISLPRLEIFTEEISHSNFTAKFVHDFEYEESFFRRDFSLNAIMFEFDGNSFKLIDPLEGILALKNKKLIPAGNNFYKDPVRILRGVRFAVKNSFLLELNMLQAKDAAARCSSHYLKMESIKSENPIRFFKKYYSIIGRDIGLEEAHFELDTLISVKSGKELETYIHGLIFLTKKNRSQLLEHLGFSIKKVKCFKYINRKSLIKLSFDDFKEMNNNFEYSNTLAFLSGLTEEVYNYYYYQLGCIDIGFEKFNNAHEINIDLRNIDLKDRFAYENYMRIRNCYE